MKRTVIALFVLGAGLPALPSDVAAAPGPSIATVVSDANWALAAQRTDGAIGHYVDRVEVWPYVANFAALGLARAAELTGDSGYLDAAWRWLAWYQGHQDASGFVTDYVVDADGSLVSKGDMDSTDAYAGTFLLAARKAWRVSGDVGRLRSLAPAIAAATRAIEATQDGDGLTWAKPTWRVKYLMDQAEAYAGLTAAVEMAAAMGDGALQQRAADDARRMRTGVERLWNPAAGAYDWAVHDTGARQSTDWSVFYPDAQQQVWPVAFGLVTGPRAKALVARFDSAQPQWDQPTGTVAYATSMGSVGYWPVTGWAFSQVGKTARGAAAAVSIRAAAVAARQAWPFTTGSAGQLIQLESADRSYLAPPVS